MEKRLDDYKIIYAQITEELSRKVLDFVKSGSGWELLGGPFTDDKMVCQAVVKYTN